MIDKFILKELKKALKKHLIIKAFVKKNYIAKSPEYEWVYDSSLEAQKDEIMIIYKKEPHQLDDGVVYGPIINYLST